MWKVCGTEVCHNQSVSICHIVNLYISIIVCFVNWTQSKPHRTADNNNQSLTGKNFTTVISKEACNQYKYSRSVSWIFSCWITYIRETLVIKNLVEDEKKLQPLYLKLLLGKNSWEKSILIQNTLPVFKMKRIYMKQWKRMLIHLVAKTAPLSAK